jgi:hypothetical protein
MPDFGIFRGFNEKLFGDKLYAGQLPINLGLIGSENSNLLLDSYPNAAAAYSLRKLRNAYTGSAIEVRRTNNDVADIGFTSTGALDTAALLAFTGTGALNNGFVTKWYDQSGNGRDATQATAINQPQIVSAGSVINVNSKPSLLFDGVNDSFGVTLSSALLQPNSFGIVFKYNNSTDSNHDLIDSSPNTPRTLIDTVSNNFRLFAGTSVTSVASTTNQTLLFSLFNGSNSELSINSVNVTSLNTGTAGITTFNIGHSVSVNNFLFGNMQEVLFYNSNQSSNRTGIETNINDFYSIY